MPAYERLREARGAEAGETRGALDSVVVLNEAWGRQPAAAEYRARRGAASTAANR